jgi:hypothetical protein
MCAEGGCNWKLRSALMIGGKKCIISGVRERRDRETYQFRQQASLLMPRVEKPKRRERGMEVVELRIKRDRENGG